MQQPLKLAIAGLGTVGGGVVQPAQASQRPPRGAARAGRSAIGGVSARSKGKKRGADIGQVSWFDDPVELATDPAHRRVRRTDRRRGWRCQSRGRGRARSRQARGNGEQGVARQARHRAGQACRGPSRRAQFRSRRRRRHPDRQGAARKPRRQRGAPRQRHPERHLQLHPDRDGDREALLRATC